MIERKKKLVISFAVALFFLQLCFSLFLPTIETYDVDPDDNTTSIDVYSIDAIMVNYSHWLCDDAEYNDYYDDFISIPKTGLIIITLLLMACLVFFSIGAFGANSIKTSLLYLAIAASALAFVHIASFASLSSCYDYYNDGSNVRLLITFYLVILFALASWVLFFLFGIPKRVDTVHAPSNAASLAPTFCPMCGAPTVNHAPFCHHCGADLKRPSYRS